MTKELSSFMTPCLEERSTQVGFRVYRRIQAVVNVFGFLTGIRIPSLLSET